MLKDADKSQDFSAKSSSRQYYYHRATKQVRWDQPQGWNAERARAHQVKLRESMRKLLHYDAHNETNHGEGRLCWTTDTGMGRAPSEYPAASYVPELGKEAPNQDLPDCPVDPVQRHWCEYLELDVDGQPVPVDGADGKPVPLVLRYDDDRKPVPLQDPRPKPGECIPCTFVLIVQQQMSNSPVSA